MTMPGKEELLPPVDIEATKALYSSEMPEVKSLDLVEFIVGKLFSTQYDEVGVCNGQVGDPAYIFRTTTFKNNLENDIGL